MKKKVVPVISLKDVIKTYKLGEDNKVYALKKATLDIYPGEFVSILGPSGSGKSTLMHIMGFLDQPSGGDIIFDGQKITSFTENELANIRNNQIGFVFQQFNLLSRTSSLDNVGLPLIYVGLAKKERDKISEKVLKLVGLGDRLDHHSNQLSGGQQQRVAIARALVNEPKLIFADEPTGNLDSKSGKEIMEIFGKLHHQGKTIIIVTHDEKLARIAHRTIYIKDGEIKKDYENK
jgi:putative ABC transport system ATP-binding protein